jgi:uncharacterized membrane protein
MTNINARILNITLIILAAVGLTDAGYLTVKHYAKTNVICSLSQGCEKVLNSEYSVIFGIPVALFGVVFYFVILILAVHFFARKTYHWVLNLWAAIGLVSTLYLLILQAFVIKVWCQFCLLSAITSIGIFVASVLLYIVRKKNIPRSESDN